MSSSGSSIGFGFSGGGGGWCLAVVGAVCISCWVGWSGGEVPIFALASVTKQSQRLSCIPGLGVRCRRGAVESFPSVPRQRAPM